jgi:hypothetical protein
MGQYRKKPVVIEAVRWDGRKASETPDWLMKALNMPGAPDTTPGCVMRLHDKVHIGTLEGVVVASPGDYIIRGVKGELYPCKPDIFAATYEPASPALTDPNNEQ